MYLQYFGLNEAPFAITPDPAFVYLSQRHKDALAHLLYGIGQGGSGGFVQLTGEVGTGKTTLCRCLLEQVPDDTRIALILNPMITPTELLAAICEELNIDTTAASHSSKLLVDRLNRYLLDTHARGERVVVVIDEAQNLSTEALEQVRLLTNLETSKDKLLQIVLLGQPELRDLLQKQDLRQLAQRITARYHLTPLNHEETIAYIRHRMAVAGAVRNPFTRSGIKALYQLSGGVPRLINIIADRALVGAFAREKSRVDAKLVHQAAREVLSHSPVVRQRRWLAGSVLVGLLAIAMLLGLRALKGPAPETTTVGTTQEAAVEQVDAAETVAVSNPPVQQEPPATELAPETVTTLDIGQWLQEQDGQVWRDLGAIWGAQQDAGLMQAICVNDIPGAYACLREQGSWGRIQRLGLPVLLILQADQRRLLLLRGMNGDQLLLGSDNRQLSRNDLEAYWLGEFYVLWPQAEGWPNQIKRDDSGLAVDIVMQLAAGVDTPYTGEPVFDEQFENWLKSFQLRHGLEADGIVGPNTLVYLMAPSIPDPRLLQEWESME